jgi:hypothetical protein
MRMILGAFWSLAALLIAAPALAASTTTTTTTTTQTHTIAQPIHVVPVGPCVPAQGAGDRVVIPGVPNFQAQSIAVGTSASSMQLESGSKEGRGEHGFITITKQSDAASPDLLAMVEHHTVLQTVAITMRKAGGQPPLVFTLSNVSVTGIKHPSPKTETVVFQYQTLSECSPPSSSK